MNYEWCAPGAGRREPPPALPPRPGREPAPQVPPRRDLELERADWYWGNVSREEVSEKLNGQPDGTFLVRDSHTASGEYTLCLVSGGVIRLVRIYNMNGWFGFTDLRQFNSVSKLIDYYRRESLHEWHPQLTVRLERPLVDSRQHHDSPSVSSLISQLQETYSTYDSLLVEMEHLERHTSALSTSIAVHKKAQEAYRAVSLMFSDQLRLAQHIKAELHERDQVQLNKRQLDARAVLVKQRQQHVEGEIVRQAAALKDAESQLDLVHHQERELQRRKHDLEVVLLRHGVSQERLEKLLEGSASGPADPDCVPLSEQESLWLLEDYDRERAEALLRDKPDGTFLIRPHTQVPQNPGLPYAMSIVSQAKPRHCYIFKSQRGYGFSMPYAIHHSLKALVDHYSTRDELSTFNEEMPDRLLYPALGDRVG